VHVPLLTSQPDQHSAHQHHTPDKEKAMRTKLVKVLAPVAVVIAAAFASLTMGSGSAVADGGGSNPSAPPSCNSSWDSYPCH